MLWQFNSGNILQTICSYSKEVILWISLSDCILCTPMGGPLAEGKLEGYVVQCPWHGSRYDVRSSEVVRPPAMRPEPACIRG